MQAYNPLMLGNKTHLLLIFMELYLCYKQNLHTSIYRKKNAYMQVLYYGLIII